MATVKTRVGEPSKELELLNFKAFLLENPELFVGKKTHDAENTERKPKLNNRVSPESKNARNEQINQFTAFQGAMKFLLFYGQCVALNPVTGILEKDLTKIRYRWLSLKVLYCLIVGLAQVIAAILSVYRLFDHGYFIRSISFCSFYICTICTTFIFLRVATKWPSLMKELYNCGLEEYVDHKLKFKCYLAFFIIVGLAIAEHVLSQIAKYSEVIDCRRDYNLSLYGSYIHMSFPWIYNFGATYFLPVCIVLHVIIIISTFSWSYPDLFIISISIYLTSVLNCINKKIEAAQKSNFLPPHFWRCLREDYNRATQLVRSFDDNFSGVVFVSFANNLFFICLQLYYSLANGIHNRNQFLLENCPNFPSGPFGGHESSVYLIFSLFFLFGKFLSVSLIASGVNTASMESAPALYNIASVMYCSEVQRFLDQIHGDIVALSGFQFFYVTREIILSVAGTIVTYELVMLQFSTE